MNDTWLQGFSTIKFRNELDRQQLPEDDFRRTGPLIFKTIALLCNLAEFWINETTIFFEKNRMVSASALPSKSETSSLVRCLLSRSLHAENMEGVAHCPVQGHSTVFNLL